MKNKRKCENAENDENDDFEELEQTSAYVRWGMDAEQNNAVHTRVTARGIGMVKTLPPSVSWFDLRSGLKMYDMKKANLVVLDSPYVPEGVIGFPSATRSVRIAASPCYFA